MCLLTPIKAMKRTDQCQKDKLNAISKAFSVIEQDYSVKVPDSEIFYIYDIVYRNTDSSMIEEDF